MSVFRWLRSLATASALASVFSVAGYSEDGGGMRQDREHVAISHSNFTKETLVYKTIGHLNIKADVYRMSGTDSRPAIIWIHGGALIFGSREMLPADERDRFLRAGYVIVAIDCRLAPESKLPAILKDVEDAHTWVHDKGPTLFHIDSERIAAVGQSAGAYLALMAGARVRPRLKAVVSFYGYGNIDGSWYSRPNPIFLGLPRISKEDANKLVGTSILSESSPAIRSDFYTYCRQNGTWAQQVAGLNPSTEAAKFYQYDPERLFTAGYPPTMLLHGDHDTDVPFDLSRKMAAALEREHVVHRLYRMEGFNHLFDVYPDGLPPNGKPIGLANPKASEAFQAVLVFLATQMRN